MNFDPLITQSPVREPKCSDVFFPSAIRFWNYLHQCIRNAYTVNEFKMKLSKPRKINAYYSMGSICINSNLASMGKCCSQLKSDIYRHNFA